MGEEIEWVGGGEGEGGGNGDRKIIDGERLGRESERYRSNIEF